MADLTQTVTNNMNLFGGSPPALWNQYNWNAFVYGGTTPVIWHLEMITGGNTLTLTDALDKTLEKVIGESLAATSDVTAIYLQNSTGWYYNFPDRVTNANSMVTAGFGSVAVSSTSWTANLAGGTTWS